MTKWDKVYRHSGEEGLRPPSPSLVKYLDRLPSGKALDLACGMGRNAIFLAGRGYQVDAVDGSVVALEKGLAFAREAALRVNFIHADLTDFRIEPDAYNLIICYYYLERSLAEQIIKGLKEGGVLLFETYTKEQKTIGPPLNDDYLLGPNELPDLFSELHPIIYREGIVNEEGKHKGIATLLAKRQY